MVGKICTVCKNYSYLNKNLSFFTYPGDPERRRQWLSAVDRLDLLNKLENNKTRTNHRICEVHFEKKYVYQSSDTAKGRKHLSKDAVPTLHLDNAYSGMSIPAIPGINTIDNFKRRLRTRLQNKLNQQDLDVSMERADVSQFCEATLEEPCPTQPFLSDNKDNTSSNLHVRSKRRKIYEVSITKYIDTPTESCTDLSALCESVLKVSKSCQTVLYEKSNIETVGKRRQIIENICDNNILQHNLSTSAKIDKNLLSLNLHYSGNAYDLLKNMLELPTIDTLKQFLFLRTTKINDKLCDILKAKVKNMSAKERICSVALDCIKPNLYYDIKSDRLLGVHDVNGKQKLEVADYAILIVAQGIVELWVQPITYAFISDGCYNSSEISMWIETILSTLMEVGLDVRAYIPDSRSKFDLCDSKKSVSEKLYITINNKRIFYFYDTAQSMTHVKHYLETSDFYYNYGNVDCNISNEFLQKVSNLYDILNASSRYSVSPYKRALSKKKYQIDYLTHMRYLLLNLKVVNKVNGEEMTKNIQFIDHLIITVSNIMDFIEELSILGVKFLFTHRLSHNFYLTKFFDRIQDVETSEGSKECTGKRFHKTFIRSFVFNILKKPLGNTKPTLGRTLEIEKYSEETFNHATTTQSGQNYPLRVYTTDYRQCLPEKNVFVYVCGYLYYKCLQKHSCCQLKRHLRKVHESHSKKGASSRFYHCSINLGGANRKMLPSDAFNNFIMLLEDKIRKYLNSNVVFESVGREMLKEIEYCEFEAPCPCFPLKYLKTLFIRVRLFYTVKKNNKIFRKPNSVAQYRTFKL